MSVTSFSPVVDSPAVVMTDIPPGHIVIAAVIERRGRIALFKRSSDLVHDGGLWHCITGFLEVGASPEQQAREELLEEAGLHAKDLLDLRQGPALVLTDNLGAPWLIHTFTALTSRGRLTLDWEHESCRWTTAPKVKRFANRVPWLDNVLNATGHFTSPGPLALAEQIPRSPEGAGKR